MDFTRAYTSEISMRGFDPSTWSDFGDYIPITGFTYEANAKDPASLLRTATVNVDEPLDTGWYKFYMTATQGSSERFPMGVYLFSKRSTKYDYGIGASSEKGYSPLKPLELARMPLGGYAPKGSDGAALAASYIAGHVNAPVTVEGGFELAQHVVYPQNCTYLRALWMLLDAGGYAMVLDGDGAVHIGPMPSEPSLTLDRDSMGMLMPGVSEDVDDLIPNRFYAVQGGSVAVSENLDNGPTSYRERGFWVDSVDTSVVRVNGETLQAYADRKLREGAVRKRQISYTREYAPGVEPLHLVSASIPEIGMDGHARIVSQKVDCSYGAVVGETLEFGESLW